MGSREVESFLSHLATTEKVAASTQRQALNTLAFLYRDASYSQFWCLKKSSVNDSSAGIFIT